MRFAGARGKGAMAVATRRGIEPWERVFPDLFRKILACDIGSHDRDMAVGTRCHGGCDIVPTTPIYWLTCARGGMQTHNTHQAILHGFLTRTLGECRIPNGEEFVIPFKDGASRWARLPSDGCRHRPWGFFPGDKSKENENKLKILLPHV